MAPSASNIIEKIPVWARAAIWFAILALIFAAFFFSIFMPQQRALEGLRKDLGAKKEQLIILQNTARQLPKMKERLAELRSQLTQALKRLPNDKEIPLLIKNIEEMAKVVGLDVKYVKLQRLVNLGFFSSIPIDILVKGGFHNTILFFDALNKLPRIINISNIKISDPDDKEAGRTTITTSCLAVTYKFNDQVQLDDDATKVTPPAGTSPSPAPTGTAVKK